MSVSKVFEYNSAMTSAKAEDAILNIQTTNFHTFKKDIKSKIIRNLKSQANKHIKRSSGALPTYGEVLKDLRSKLGGN